MKKENPYMQATIKKDRKEIEQLKKQINELKRMKNVSR